MAGRKPDPFGPWTSADWRALVRGRAGTQAEDLLLKENAEGIGIPSLCTHDEEARGVGVLPYARRLEGPRLASLVAEPTFSAACARVTADLEQGVDAFVLRWGEGRQGVPLKNEAELEQMFEAVDLGRVLLVLDAGAEFERAVPIFLSFLKRRNACVAGQLGIDPLLAEARGEVFSAGLEAALGAMAELTRLAESEYAPVRAIEVSTTVYHDAGASVQDELAFMLATGVCYLRSLDARGILRAGLAPRLCFRFALESDGFVAAAKLRVARHLWGAVVSACSLEPGEVPPFICAEQSWRALTVRSPELNLVRSTLAGFGAFVGGADMVRLLPWDGAFGRASPAGSDLGHHVSQILAHEASLGHVFDPLAGSWSQEHLCRTLSEGAWTRFQQIEKRGGMSEALRDGWIHQKICESRDRRLGQVFRREARIVGVNHYPSLDRAPFDAQDARPVTAQDPAALLPRVRWSESFERLRDLADAWQRTHGAPPELFLVSRGAAEHHQASLHWAQVLSCGGIHLRRGATAQESGEVLQSYQKSGLAAAAFLVEEWAQEDDRQRMLLALRALDAVCVVSLGGQGTAKFGQHVDVALQTGSDLVQAMMGYYRLAGVGDGDARS